MRYLILLLILVSLSGCFATKNRCQRLYPPVSSSDTIIKETVRDSVVYKDTTVTVTIQGEIIHDSIPFQVYVPKNIRIDTARGETEFAKAKAYYSAGAIHIILEQKETDLKIKLNNAIKESYQWKEKYQKIYNQKVTEVKYIPVIYRIAFWLWIGVLITIFGFIGLKISKII